MTESSYNQPTEEASKQGIAVDFKRVLARAIRFWYLFVLSIAICFAIAFIKNRYSERIYPVNASIIIKEQQEISGGKLLYDNPLVSYYRNYYNELYLIKSYPLIQSAIDELDFETSFHREGNFLVSESYKSVPVKASVAKERSALSAQFYFTVLDDSYFELRPTGEFDEEKNPELVQKFLFGDSVTYNNLHLVFRKTGSVQSVKDIQYIFKYTHPKLMVGGYVGKLNADWAQERAGVINLSSTGPLVQKEIDFLAGVIAQYQIYDLDKKNQTASLSIDFINRQLSGISDSLRRAEMKVQGFKNKNLMTDLNQEASHLYERIKDLELQKTQLTISDRYFNYLTDYLGTQQSVDQVILPTSVGIQDNILSALVEEMVRIQTSLKLVTNSEQSSNPLILDKKKRVMELRANISEAVKNQKAVNKITLDFIANSVRDLERQMNDLPDIERQYIRIKRDFALLENLYVFLLQKRAEVSISKAANTSDIVVVNPPMQSGGPISPKTSQNYSFAMFIGFGVPLAFCFLLEIFNNRVQSREDIEKITRIPFIGGVGHKKTGSVESGISDY